MRALCLFFLFLALTSCVHMETCPTKEEIYPCECEEDESGTIIVTCSEASLNLLSLKSALNSLSNKKDVDLMLSDLKIGILPSTFFFGIGIKRLELSHCDLDALTDGKHRMFLGLENYLEELLITSSFTEENVPAKLDVGHLIKLREMDLSYNTISVLGDDWFERGPASLEYLTISNNGIEKIGKYAFTNLINLKQLSLDGNRFGPIQRSMLPSTAPRLKVLELDNNALRDIPEDLFKRMPVLSRLSLRTNGISILDERTWSPVWQKLDSLLLEGNPITCDGHMNWIFKLKRPSIFGTCYAPKEFEGQNLKKFIDSRSQS